MIQTITTMLKNYEQGKISRRTFVLSLSAIAASSQMAVAEESTFKGISINHIALRVTDISRSREFYQKHLGLPVIRETQSNCFLGVGDNFLALFRNQKPGLDHYCLAIEDFDADRAVRSLEREGLPARRPSGTNRVYFPDPDGLEVQLSSPTHRA